MVSTQELHEARRKVRLCQYGWLATRAIKESKLSGETLVVAVQRRQELQLHPQRFQHSADAIIFHFTSNNTIFGTQFKQFPKSPIP